MSVTLTPHELAFRRLVELWGCTRYEAFERAARDCGALLTPAKLQSQFACYEYNLEDQLPDYIVQACASAGYLTKPVDESLAAE